MGVLRHALDIARSLTQGPHKQDLEGRNAGPICPEAAVYGWGLIYSIRV